MAIMNAISGVLGMSQGRPKLTPEEQNQLDSCVAAVKQGCQAFAKAGAALMAIKQRQLYRSTHDTFEAFCEHQFGLTSRRVNQLVESASICLELTKHIPGSPLPRIEAEVRPLAGLSPADQAATWKEAVEVSAPAAPTAAIVKQLAEKRKKSKKGKSKKVAKPIRFKVPGATVVVIPNKAWTGDPVATLQEAISKANTPEIRISKAA